MFCSPFREAAHALHGPADSTGGPFHLGQVLLLITTNFTVRAEHKRSGTYSSTIMNVIFADYRPLFLLIVAAVLAFQGLYHGTA